MENQRLSARKFATNYGLILGTIMVLISVIMYATGMALEGTQWPVFIYYIIFPVVIMLAISKYKKHNANSLTLGEAMKVGMVTAVISAVVYMVYILLFNYVIDPEFSQQALELAREKLMDNPNMTEEMIEQSMKWGEKLSNPILTGALWIVMSSIFGAIYSVIGGLVMKSE